MTTNFNAKPYFDDFDEDRKFYKILFKPSLAVQARELTQLQTALQKQIERFGSSIYKEGAQILGGTFGYTNELHAVKLTSTFNSYPVDDYIDQFKDVEIYGETTGVKATVITYTQSNSTDAPTLFVKYSSTGYDRIATKFAEGENIITTSTQITGVDAGSPIATTAAVDATAIGASANIERGVYFTQGHFVLVDAQRIILSKYSNNPTARIGLKIVESVVTSNDDSSLLDNAQGTPNFAARGADRYVIDLQLSALDVSASDDSNFIELGRVNEGVLVGKVETSPYSVLEDNLARRTYDINGDYFVKPYQVRVRESLNDGLNNGVFDKTSTTNDTQVAPTEDMVAVQVSAGKAYIKGYEITTTDTIFIDDTKTRTPDEVDELKNRSTPMELGAYVRVFNAHNIPEMVGSSGSANFDPFYFTGLYDAQTTVPGSPSGNQVGVCRVRAFETEYANTGLVLDSTALHKAYIFDVQMFTTLTTSVAHGLVAGTFVTGSSSKASGYVHSSSSGTTLKLTSVTGTFSTGETLLAVDTGVTSAYTITSQVSHKFDEVKQLHTAYSTATRNFSADVRLDTQFVPIGTMTITGTSISGFGTTFLTELEAGDIISIPSGAGGTPEQRVVLSVTNNTTATLSSAVTNNVTSVTVTRLRSAIVDQNKDILLRQLVKPYIKTLKTTSNTLQSMTSIEVRREFIAVTDSAGSFTLTAGPNETFNANSNIDYQVSVVTLGAGATVAAGDIINMDNVTFTPTGGTVTIGSGSLGDGTTVKVNATINRAAVASKSKTPHVCELLEVVNQVTGAYGTSVLHKELSMGVADVYRIRAIYSSATAGTTAVTPTITGAVTGLFQSGETIIGGTSGAIGTVVTTTSPMMFVQTSGASFVSGEVITGQTSTATITATAVTAGDLNVTNRYLLDSGQRDNFYDISRLTLKQKMSIPPGNLLVVYDYFEHQDGDFFTVDSYDSVSYKDIPVYSATRIDPETEQSTGVFDLRSVVDFRPRVADAVSTVVGGYKRITGNSFDFQSRNFKLAGASTTNIYKDNANFEYDVEYYLARIDSLFLTSKGVFKLVKGVSADVPIIPEEMADAVRIADIYFDPYVLSVEKNVRVKQNIAKRFTMADIERLEKRVSNVEYYTSLSLLEKSAETMQVKDNYGLDRFKSGFIVDNFTGHSVGDVLNQDYRCAMDMSNKTLRPMFKIKSVPLEETAKTDAARTTAGYVVKDGYAMLPYTEVVSTQQPYATTIENLNPALKFGWNGHMKLTPSADEWFETEKLPVVNITIDNYSTFLAQNKNSIGTVWDAPIINWSGVPVVTTSNRTTTSTDWFGTTTDTFRIVNTTETGTQTQKGIETSIIEKLDVTSSGNKLVSTSLVPYMRQKEIQFEAHGMKPYTRVYPSFDGIDVSKYCTPTGGSVSFLSVTNTPVSKPKLWTSLSSLVINYSFISVIATAGQVNVNVEVSDTSSGPWIQVGSGILLPTQTSLTLTDTSFNPVLNSSTAGEKFVRLTITQNNALQSNVRIQEITIGAKNGATDVSSLDGYVSIDSFTGIRNPKPQILIDTTIGTVQPEDNILFGYPSINSTIVLKVVGGPVDANVSTLSTVTHYIAPSNTDSTKFITDGVGFVSGTFYLPDPKAEGVPKFETGIRQFKLESVTTSSSILPETQAVGEYSATGVLTKTQETVTRTRSGSLSTTNRTSSATVSRSNTTETFVGSTFTAFDFGGGGGDGGTGDPLSQSFYLTNKEGEFATKFDIFFYSKDDSIPVTLQLREMANGIPTKVVVPGSTVTLNPENVSTSDDGNTPTTFTFDAPVYLDGSKEYALVLLTNSSKYLAWISRMGERTADNTRFVSEQPNLGVLFKSQNNRTWTAYDMEDLKFTMYRAKFSTATGTLKLQNATLPAAKLEANPFELFSTTTVKVYHPDHGMFATTNKVIISGSGSAEVPDGEYAVSNQNLDYYTIELATAATTSGRVGGSNVTATENAIADSFQVMVPTVVLPDTQVKTSVQMSTATSPSGSQSSFGNQYLGNISLIDRYDNRTPVMITSEINEQKNRGGEKSAFVTMELSTTKDNLTPLVDLERKSITTYSNRLDYIVDENDVFPTSTYVPSTSPDSDSSESVYMTKKIQLSVPATAINFYIDVLRNNSANVTFMYKTLRVDDSRSFDDVSWEDFSVNIRPNPVADRETFLEYKSTVEGLPEFISFAIKVKMDGTNSCEVPMLKNLRAIALAL